MFSLGMIIYYILTEKEHFWPDTDFDEEYIVNMYENSNYE